MRQDRIGTKPGVTRDRTELESNAKGGRSGRLYRLIERGRAYAPLSHFFMKLVLAAPASFLPSEPTALAAQASAMHFFMNDVFAAPASGLPSLPTAWVSQESCAKADPAAKVAMMAARNIRFM